MNGRLYDPTIDKFLSPDPFIQNPYNTQNFNRYSYVMNNPYLYIDPSGYNYITSDGMLVISEIDDPNVFDISINYDNDEVDLDEVISFDLEYNQNEINNGIMSGVDYVNKASYPAAVCSAYTANVPATFFFSGAGLFTDYILYLDDKKTIEQLGRDNIIDTIKPPGLKGKLIGTAVKETMNQIEKNNEKNNPKAKEIYK